MLTVAFSRLRCGKLMCHWSSLIYRVELYRKVILTVDDSALGPVDGNTYASKTMNFEYT